LILSSLARGSTVRVVDLEGCRPYAILVTPGWGFVAVAARKLEEGKLGHVLSVYTVNGHFVRSRPVAGPVVAWTAWTAADGADFMIVAGEQGKLNVAEVWSIELAPLKAVAAPVVAVRCDPREGGCVVVSGQGEVAWVPFGG
jgi:hypothetical protein